MENNIKIRLPLAVSYDALERVLKQKMIGESIPPASKMKEGESPYARILDISLSGSTIAGYDLFLALNIRVLRTMLKRDNVDLYVPVMFDYDNETQQLFVRKYKVDVKTNSNFYDKALEVLANNVAHDQIIKRARLDLGARIAQEKNKVNTLLTNGLEIKGAVLTGTVERVVVEDISMEADKVSLLLVMEGNISAEIRDLLSLMPKE